MTKRDLPSIDVLRQLIIYDPESGILIWKHRETSLFKSSANRTPEASCRSWNARYAGKEILGSMNKDGYRQFAVGGSFMLHHRAAWAIFWGNWPSGQIDHINMDKLDNKISNLRDVSNWENQQNRGMRSSNTSGRTGVYITKYGRFRAAIFHGEKCKHLGVFDTLDEAGDAYELAKMARRNPDSKI